VIVYQIEMALIKVSFSFSLSSLVVCENAVLFGVGHNGIWENKNAPQRWGIGSRYWND